MAAGLAAEHPPEPLEGSASIPRPLTTGRSDNGDVHLDRSGGEGKSLLGPNLEARDDRLADVRERFLPGAASAAPGFLGGPLRGGGPRTGQGAQPLSVHASQQLGCVPVQALCPSGAVQCVLSLLVEHLVDVTPCGFVFVRQHVTNPGLPQVERE